MPTSPNFWNLHPLKCKVYPVHRPSGPPLESSHISLAIDLVTAVDMGAYYDEIEIEDMAWDDVKKVFHYPCPCGDRFEISRKQLKNYEDTATCPSCSLIIRVIYDPVSGRSIYLLG